MEHSQIFKLIIFEPVLIYASYITPRLVYITNWIFTGVYQAAYRLTDNRLTFEQETGPKLNYSDELFMGVPCILPSGLLNETTVAPQKIVFKKEGDEQYPFATGNGLMGFDVFSAAFYMITRYEEHLSFTPNQYGQFKAVDSISYKLGNIYEPVVDSWLKALKEKLSITGNSVQQRFLPLFTYDVDTAYAFKGREIGVTLGHYAKDILSGKFSAVKERRHVLSGRQPDPYDTYDATIAFIKDSGLEPLFFFLLGDRNKYNRNLEHDSELQTALLKKISAAADTGLHPSYYTMNDAELLQEEKQRMEQVTGKRVIKSRQHYLRLQFPATYRQLAAAGIQEDHSMGFAEMPGFRAGTCFPFYFFDLEKNVTTTLKIFPVTFMEGSFAEDMRMTPEASLPIMLQLLETVKKLNGFFCCIWHNHTLSDHGIWKGWKDVHDKVVKAAVARS